MTQRKRTPKKAPRLPKALLLAKLAGPDWYVNHGHGD